MNNQTYIKILYDTLIKKNRILEDIMQLTVQQENILAESSLDFEKFDECISQKEVLIDQINQLDDGFETLYERVKEEFSLLIEKNESLIKSIQELIKDIVSKSTRLQVLENKNKLALDLFLTNQKQEVRTIKKNNKMATSYYGNMSGQNLNNSFFFDKKK